MEISGGSGHLFTKYDHGGVGAEYPGDLKKISKSNCEGWLEEAYKMIRKHQFSDIDISTLFNINREMHQTNKSLIAAVKEYILQPMQSYDLDAIET